MRLINVDTFALQEFAGVYSAPPYAILSHTWGDEEVSYQDLQNRELSESKAGFEKIRYTCLQAKADGLKYAWVDTCCIEKSSSQELSEAINSMYAWYMNATVCYVYLSDIPGHCPRLDDYVHPLSLHWIEAFEGSRWFTRGWTLQELIAPRRTLFFGCCWNPIGALANLVQLVSGITNIQEDVLHHTRPLSDLTIARRLSWAATRKTTRREDEAYCLFGILDVNMPLLYGEGQKAFLRLQEAIIHQSTDQSILAWDSPSGPIEPRELLLAPSPRCFTNGGKLRRRRGTASESAFNISNKGLTITLPIVRRRLHEDPESPDVTLGILDCKYEGSSDVLALVMTQHPFNIHSDTTALELYVSGYERMEQYALRYARLLPISPADLLDMKPTLLTITKDLQSQTYMQAFNTNETTWFPIRFTGDEPSSVPRLKDVSPEHCWYPTSQTLRLKGPHDLSGGIMVNIKDGRSVLITFGISGPSRRAPPTARKIYKLRFIHPECPAEPHVRSLMRNDWSGAGETAGLKLNRDERLVARIWRGALTVSVENVSESSIYTPSSAGALSPPTSPLAERRKPSFSLPNRRDSMLQDSRSESSDSSYEERQQLIHRTILCEYCRASKAREDAEQQRRSYEEWRKAEELEAERRKAEKQRNLKKRATQAGVGFSMGSMLFDAMEFL